MLDKWKKILKKETDAIECTVETEEQEYVQYAQEFEKTLRTLEANLHSSDDAEEIAMMTLKTACDFYQADWCGLVEVDLDLKLWTPFWWYNTNPNDRTVSLIEEIESAEHLYRWIAAIRDSHAMIIYDKEDVKLLHPEEYAEYERFGVNSILGVPIKPRPTGFLIVRNPKRYLNRSSMLQMLAYVVIASVNEKKLLDSAKMVLSPDNIKNDTDIIINLFGNLEIYTSKGVLREADIKSPKICRMLTYLLLSKKEMITSRELVEDIWPDEAIDMDNPGKKMKSLVYRFRQMFSLISDYQLIESAANGYRINPQLHIITDLQQFNNYYEAAQKASSTSAKADLLKLSVELYKGNLLESAEGEHWLMHEALHYNLKYLGVTNELLKTLSEKKDYPNVLQYATQALKIEPGNMQAYYWLINSMYRLGATEMAKSEVKVAKQHLTKEEFGELLRCFKKTKGLQLDNLTIKKFI